MKKNILIIAAISLFLSACKNEEECECEKLIKVTVTTETCRGSYPEDARPDEIGVTVIRDGKYWGCLYKTIDPFIEGFNHIEGYEYELLILEIPYKTNFSKPEPACLNKYKFVEVLSMKTIDVTEQDGMQNKLND